MEYFGEKPQMKICTKSHCYTLKSSIYHGIFGNTFLAIDENAPTKQYQITIESKQKIDNLKMSGQVRLEHDLLTSLRHQNVIYCSEIFEDQLNFYVICDFFSDITLSKKITGLHRIPEDKLNYIFSQLVEVFYYLHSNGFAYGSIRPESVLINDKFELALSDFTLIQSLTLPIPRDNYLIPPPEVLNGQCKSTALSEVFALGVLLYMIASRGSMPWEFHSDSELINLYQNFQILQPPSMSNSFFSLIQQMLELNPEKRITMLHLLQHASHIKSSRVKFQVQPIVCHKDAIKKRRTSMKTIIGNPSDNYRKRGSENNPSIGNISPSFSSTGKFARHRKSVIPKANRAFNISTSSFLY